MINTLACNLIQSVEVVHVEKNKFALYGNDKIFFVGEMLYDIFRLRKEGFQIEEIYEFLEQKNKVFPSLEKIEEVIEFNLDKIFKQPAQKDFDAKSRYIYGQIKIIPKPVLAKISNALSFLFNRYIFTVVGVMGCVWTFLLVKSIFLRGMFDSSITLKDGIFLFIVSYVFLIVVGMIHEFGHSSAAARFGVPAKEVG